MRQIITFLTLFLFACGHQTEQQQNETTNNSLGSHVDLTKTTPLNFLKRLRLNYLPDPTSPSFNQTKSYEMCNPAPKDWITKNDIKQLIPYLDSNNVFAFPVFSTIASITIENHGQSTLANEAYALIHGYRTGTYPPYSSIPLGGRWADKYKLADSLKKEVLIWWTTEEQK